MDTVQAYRKIQINCRLPERTKSKARMMFNSRKGKFMRKKCSYPALASLTADSELTGKGGARLSACSFRAPAAPTLGAETQ